VSWKVLNLPGKQKALASELLSSNSYSGSCRPARRTDCQGLLVRTYVMKPRASSRCDKAARRSILLNTSLGKNVQCTFALTFFMWALQVGGSMAAIPEHTALETNKDRIDEAAHPASVGILFVHGIGHQRKGETLLRFGEPLFDWLKRWLAEAKVNGECNLHLGTPWVAGSRYSLRNRGRRRPFRRRLSWRRRRGHAVLYLDSFACSGVMAKCC
jgi:hypothetical protein